MGNATCQFCGWFNPEKDGSFFCLCIKKTVRKYTAICKYAEFVNGKDEK